MFTMEFGNGSKGGMTHALCKCKVGSGHFQLEWSGPWGAGPVDCANHVYEELIEHSEWLHLSNEKNWKQLESEGDIYRKRENVITSWGDGKVLDIIKMAMIFAWM